MRYELCDNKFIFKYNGMGMCLKNIAEGVWRLQEATSDGFQDKGASQTISEDLGEILSENLRTLEIEENKEFVKISSDKSGFIKLSDSEIVFCDSNGKTYRKITDIRKIKDGTSVSFSLSKKERLYGTGERFNKVNQRGKRIHIYAIDRWCAKHGNSYCPIPFVLSSECNAIFLNRYEHSIFDLGRGSKETFVAKQLYAPLDIYIFTSTKPTEIIENYSNLTGFAPMPPKWGFGTLVCRYHPEFETKEGVFAMADAMEKEDFPWDAVILEGFRPYNIENLPELKEITDNIHSRGKKVMLYEQCGRYPKNADTQYGLLDEYAVQSSNGAVLHETRSMNFIDNFQNKTMKCIDLTDSECLDKWNNMWGPLVDEIGIEGAKLDFCEQFPDKPDIRFRDGRDPMGAHHWYPVLFNTLRYKHFATRPDGGLTFSRGGGIGAQRFPFIWAGDQRREYMFLNVVIKAALSLGFSGVPFASWDMAGYVPSWNPFDKKIENKVFIRGLEFTAFSPCIQTHGRVKRPYDFDEHTKSVYREYSKLHECLKPYIYEKAEESVKTGIPLMRHLFLEFPNDEKCLDIEDEYMFGDSLLVAPVLNRKYYRNIYLPKGKWVDIFTGNEYDGGCVLKKYQSKLESIPVFKRMESSNQTLCEALANAQEHIININSLVK